MHGLLQVVPQRSETDETYGEFPHSISRLVFLCRTGPDWFSFILKADTSTTAGTSQVYRAVTSVIISTFENKTKPVWPSSELASVNALQV